MALKIFEKFAPRANPADSNYPYGSIKNESVPGAKDGTPLDAAWGNDMGGFTDALLADAGITPSGAADTALASQRLDALKTYSKPASTITDTHGTNVQNYIDGNLTPFKTVAGMKAAAFLSTLTEFTRVEWQGYYTQSDGGSNWGVLRFGTHAEDGGSIFSIDTNTYIEANLKSGAVNVRKFGAVGNGITDDSDAIESASNFASGVDVFFPRGVYVLKRKISTAFPLSFKGEGQWASVIKCKSPTPTVYLETTGLGAGITLTNIAIEGQPGDGSYYRAGDVGVKSFANLKFRNVLLSGFETLKQWAGGFYHKFHMCRFEQADTVFRDANANNLQYSQCQFLRLNSGITTNGGAGAISLHQCSIETWVDSFIEATSGARPLVSLTNCYIENYPSRDTVPPFAPGKYSSAVVCSGASIFIMEGTYINLNGVLRVLNNGTTDTAHVTSKGNRINYDPNSTANTDFIYLIKSLNTGIFMDSGFTEGSDGIGNKTTVYYQGGLPDLDTGSSVYDIISNKYILKPWTEIPLSNGWSSSDPTNHTVLSYRIKEGMVHLSGQVGGESATSPTLTTLPTGAIPLKRLNLSVNTQETTPTPVCMRVFPTGEVVVFNSAYTSLGAFSLDGLSFRLN